MKINFTIVFTLFYISLFSQQSLDTIYANDTKNVAVFFPKPIRQAITGAAHFVFTYNREKEQYFGLLQAKPGLESNLLVVTKDGKIYSFILSFRDKVKELNRFIDENESIGSEMPTMNEEKVKPQNDTLSFARIQYFNRASNHLLQSKESPIATSSKFGIKLQLEQMIYNGQETYLVVRIENQSGINFDVDQCLVHVLNGNKAKKSSNQRLQLTPLYVHDMPKSILDGLYSRIVFVMPKFVLGPKERLEISLGERNGNRSLTCFLK